MAANPLRELQRSGQSVWYDNIRRGLITSGELQRMIDEDGLRGVTSNPTIFEKAISGSTDYDQALQALVAQGKEVPEIFEALAIEDVQMAADLFQPVFEATEGRDGYVSFEVSPKLAHDTEATIAEARRLFRTIGRANVMIKVPATPEGIPAIERLIGEGVNVNVTLLFSLERYEQVAEAYIRGLEHLAKEGRPIERVSSVASFFVSRVDTAVDALLEARIRTSQDPEEQARLQDLLGKAAIANAKMAYQRWKVLFGGRRFSALRERGAKVQRLLWASTGTKNPNYRDVFYVEGLIGLDTVTTLPPATMVAFRGHGRVRESLQEGVGEAEEVLKRLQEAGIDLREVTGRLEEEGVKAFATSFDKLLQCIAAKREAILTRVVERQKARLGPFQEQVDATLTTLAEQGFARRLFSKDPGLWKDEADHRRIIQDRLGWLHIAEAMVERADDLITFATEVREDGFVHALLLGMGGSSLAPEVLRLTYGVAPGHPDLIVLDTTDPATILAVERSIDLQRALFIVSTKSGTTVETLSLYQYFSEKVRAFKGGRAGESFIAITDPGTPLEWLAKERKFRRLFLNPPDIGGRYSALSYFGLVPAALIGADLKGLLDRAEWMVQASASCVPPVENPGISLGVILAELFKGGRDKVTFILSPAIEGFGAWVEQLLAESTGKEGKGLVPVDGELLGDPSVYGDDRLFIFLRVEPLADEELDRKVRALEEAGHPVVRILLQDLLDLGGEFFRWEMATAVAGALMGVNPFDEPNVKESKENTDRLLKVFHETGKLPEEAPLVEGGGIALYGDPVLLEDPRKRGRRPKRSLATSLAAFFNQAGPGDYLALMAYLQRSPRYQELLQRIRLLLRDRLRVATTLGYGPRFLHSTGQLHKGGAGKGLFLQLTADDAEDLPIPAEAYTFGLLKRSQALGDLLSLRNKGRRVIRIHLKGDVTGGLERLLGVLEGGIAG